jgi:ketosteroid isomerase-like protein
MSKGRTFNHISRSHLSRILASLQLVAVLALSALSVLSRLAAAQDKAGGIEREIRSVEALRFEALAASDVPALDRLISSDLVYTHATGWRQNKAEFLSSIRSGELKYHSFTADNEKMSVYGNTVVVTGHASAKVNVKGQELDVGLLFLELYVKQDGRWQLAGWQSTRPPAP